MEPNQIITKMELITPEKARGYLNGNVMNRKANQKLVDFYAKQMKSGEWTKSGQTISLSPDGLLIDGQHRLMAIIQANVSIEMNVARNVPESSFINYDNLRSRSVSDAFHISGVSESSYKAAIISSYFSYRRGHISLAGFSNTNTRHHGLTKSKSRESNTEIINFYYSYQTLIDEINRACQNNRKKISIFPQSKFGALMLHLILEKKHDKDFVLKFFTELHSGETDNISILSLRNRFIQDLSVNVRLPDLVKLGFIKKCWNSQFRIGKPIKEYRYIKDQIFPDFI